MLIQARDLVRQQGLASLQEVALQLGVSSEVARALLAKWVAKGHIERLPTATACSGCTLCDSAPRELYRWSERRDDSSAHSLPGCNAKAPST
jgi:DeoR/GlpR family transcriptional regulator of sugar metabolism